MLEGHGSLSLKGEGLKMACYRIIETVGTGKPGVPVNARSSLEGL